MRELREVLYSGHVQGVGFRATAHRAASRLDVTGFVRNLSDGRVQLVAEGSTSELDRLLVDIAESMDGRIRETQIDTRPATNGFSRFEIRR